MKVTIVVCYVRGTHEMMSVCLGSLARHTQIPVKVIVAAKEGNIDQGLIETVKCFESEDMPVSIIEVPGRFLRQGWEHGSLLDRVVVDIDTPFALTLDSDAFPIADGWLSSLLEALCSSNDIVTAGILHPWGPPPSGLKETTTEWRVRYQHCWNATHVACQLIRTQEAKNCIRREVGYATGDDTGLGMIADLRERGCRCLGFRPTRCPKPAVDFDAEFNRYSCVVYGDAVIHVGGFTRETVDGDDAVFRNAFGWTEAKILEDGGAEFLLNDAHSYRYTLDREEEVSDEKMQRLFGLESQRMKA